jgi:hypothetical protein
MNALRFFSLSLALLVASGVALAQQQQYDSPANGAAVHVIVPWTHFGQQPARGSVNPPPAVAPLPSGNQGNDPAAPGGDTSMPASDDQQVQYPPTGYCGVGARIGPCPAQSQSGDVSSPDSVPRVFEADISKKHPHPLEPVDLPLADQSTPALRMLPDQPVDELQIGFQPAENKTGSAVQEVQDHSPEKQIVVLTAAYQQRETNRKARRAQLETAAANDPATRAVAQIETTRLLLEGEGDREITSQKLATAFAALGQELDARAQNVRDLAATRKQTALTAEAELVQLNRQIPQQELALRNMAMLPAGGQDDAMIRSLNAGLAQEENTRKLDEQQSREARVELNSLQAEANELQQAAADARRKSTHFADAARAAGVNENLLADRLEYSVARMRAADLLTTASKALDSSSALKGQADIGPLPSTAAVPVLTAPASDAVDQLRNCIRKTGNPDACRAKGGE